MIQLRNPAVTRCSLLLRLLQLVFSAIAFLPLAYIANLYQAQVSFGFPEHGYLLVLAPLSCFPLALLVMRAALRLAAAPGISPTLRAMRILMGTTVALIFNLLLAPLGLLLTFFTSDYLWAMMSTLAALLGMALCVPNRSKIEKILMKD